MPETNKQRKANQKSAYHATHKPHRKPRSRTWQKGLSAEQVKAKTGRK